MATYADHTPRSERMCSQPWPEVQLPQCQRAGKSEVSNSFEKNSNIDRPYGKTLASQSILNRYLSQRIMTQILCAGNVRSASFTIAASFLPHTASPNVHFTAKNVDWMGFFMEWSVRVRYSEV